ncbi:hypothetical protein M427DRAFT_313293 [Gonapodya prolifera JEL478]|uniref:Uncharacterized protein n=1 Tax=Gonapodya prolifera (strain JEL478) TaxID=1344416 RepID=A0A139AWT7_GONPJ|nr:hypothetical protein M427DRAFT_313293 [Gonapodya prolifera JEL478]|eukprot:KXS21190.1 hypothetical protein M427DRAFT_313293 [Gonapodya prolifera JEL478]
MSLSYFSAPTPICELLRESIWGTVDGESGQRNGCKLKPRLNNRHLSLQSKITSTSRDLEVVPEIGSILRASPTIPSIPNVPSVPGSPCFGSGKRQNCKSHTLVCHPKLASMH